MLDFQTWNCRKRALFWGQTRNSPQLFYPKAFVIESATLNLGLSNVSSRAWLTGFQSPIREGELERVQNGSDMARCRPSYANAFSSTLSRAWPIGRLFSGGVQPETRNVPAGSAVVTPVAFPLDIACQLCVADANACCAADKFPACNA